MFKVAVEAGVHSGRTAGFTKEAAPAWARRLLSLSPAAEQAVLSAVPQKLREIKRLGHGGERISDLVYHPQYGVSVRKIPLITHEPTASNIAATVADAQTQRAMEHRLRDLAGGAGPFTHILGEGPKQTAYYQFSRGVRPDEATARQAHAASAQLEATKARESAVFDRIQRMGRQGVEIPDALHMERRALNDRIDSLYAEHHRLNSALLRPLPVPAGGEAAIERLRQEYPTLHDIRGANVIGGKIVDMSPQVNRGVREGAPLKNPAAASRKHWLGGGT